MSVLPEVNRAVLVIVPRQPFVDWVNHVDSTLPAEERTPVTQEELAEHPTAFLIPMVELPQDLDGVLEDAWPEIFEAELSAWYQDEEDWPQERSLAMFEAWFEVHLHDMVFDLGHGPLKTFVEE